MFALVRYYLNNCMFFNRSRLRKLSQWQRWKKKAPKVPAITCPDIDALIETLDKYVGNREFSKSANYKIIRKLEQLRKANDSLRESGLYWYKIAKDNLRYKK